MEKTGVKLLWTGLTISIAFSGRIAYVQVMSGIFMMLGVILLWLDR